MEPNKCDHVVGFVYGSHNEPSGLIRLSFSYDCNKPYVWCDEEFKYCPDCGEKIEKEVKNGTPGKA